MKPMIISLFAIMTQAQLATWMSNINVQEKTPMQLTFPATHDSHTYSVKTSNALLRNVAQCQTEDITAQLEAGVRALDVRLKRGKQPDERLGTAHTFECDKFSAILRQIIQFLKTNGSEIVFLKLKEDKLYFGGRKMEIVELKRQVKREIFRMKRELNMGRLKCPMSHEVKDMKIKDMVRQNMRLVLMVEKDVSYGVEKTYKQVNSSKPKKLMKNIISLGEKLCSKEDSDKYRWLSMQCTTLKAAVCGYERRARASADLAVAKNQVLYDITRRTRSNSLNKLYNFVGMDMVHESGRLIDHIIKANQQAARQQCQDVRNMMLETMRMPTLPEDIEGVFEDSSSTDSFPSIPSSNEFNESEGYMII